MSQADEEVANSGAPGDFKPLEAKIGTATKLAHLKVDAF